MSDEQPDERNPSHQPTGGESRGTPDDTPVTTGQMVTAIAVVVAAGVLLLWGGCSCVKYVRHKMVEQEAAKKKEESDPKSKKNAERKLEAFRAIVAHFKKMPDPLDGKAAGDKWDAEAERLMEEFDAIPFDPVANRDVAKQIVQLCDKEIEGKYSGNRTNLLKNRVQNIAIKLTD